MCYIDKIYSIYLLQPQRTLEKLLRSRKQNIFLNYLTVAVARAEENQV